MAKHRTMSNRSRRARTVIGGIVAGGALAVAMPAALASADAPQGENTYGQETANREPLAQKNPAPVIRAVQNAGDQVFRPGSALDNSAWGAEYHARFGYSDADEYANAGPASNRDVRGENGSFQGCPE